ncbi:MAG: hypothetical protein M1552_08455 [Firmicutes bacterium]|nr:hypothetical protein [Bacillota bacterium]MCL5994169.1 hypothetical protein [Bacillota bacterium]
MSGSSRWKQVCFGAGEWLPAKPVSMLSLVTILTRLSFGPETGAGMRPNVT